jgi:redox-sensing transcriptional repressor
VAGDFRSSNPQFGEFGKQGTGYNIEFLVENLCHILKVDRVWDVAVIGAGDIGSALARYQGLSDRGFRVTMVFDSDANKIGTQIGPFIVQDSTRLVEMIQQAGVQVAMLAVPAAQAQLVTDELVKAGVRAILNYAPLNLNVPDGVWVQYTDPVTHLQRMTYYLD